jgi:hypothetical protein
MTSMKSTKPWLGIAVGALMSTAVFLAVGSASAMTATFRSDGIGFNSEGLEDLPVGPITDPVADFLKAGAPGTDPNLVVELIGSQDICVLPAGGNVCQENVGGLTGPFLAIVTVEVNVLDTSVLDGSFTLFLNSLVPNGYGGMVSIVLDPVAPPGLVTSGVGDFVFDGTFDPFVHLEFTAGNTVLADYIGWTVQDGDLITFLYAVDVAPVGGFAPQFSANATTQIVPEPNTALLMGLGLAGLVVGCRRKH